MAQAAMASPAACISEIREWAVVRVLVPAAVRAVV